jgi:hypothetical protein
LPFARFIAFGREDTSKKNRRNSRIKERVWGYTPNFKRVPFFTAAILQISSEDSSIKKPYSTMEISFRESSKIQHGYFCYLQGK